MIEVVQALTPDQFRAFRALLDEMAMWDAAETRAAGYDPAALLVEGYAGTSETLQAAYTAEGCAMYLCQIGVEAVGCAGFSRVTERMAEVEKVFVRPVVRGRGAGNALIARVLADLRARGYSSARLETADFMVEAQAMYRRHGFVTVSPFRRSIGDTGDMSVFMACDLRARPPT
jgi:ribosomal protein S18 acetylase RimI-like enzyme